MKEFLKNKMLNEIYSNVKYFYFSIFLSVYVFLSELVLLRSFNHLIIIVASMFFMFLLSKISKTLFILIFFITLVLNSIILHIGLLWGSNGLASRIQVITFSPFSEMSEYLNTYIGFRDLLILLFLLFGIYFLFVFFNKYVNKYKNIKIISFFTLVFSLSVLYNLNFVEKVLPFNYYVKYKEAIEWKQEMLDRNNFIKENFKLNSYDTKSPYNKIIIILGESANKNNMSSYGYNKKTTPFIDELMKKDNLYRFNAISPSNQTRYSIPLNLTNAQVNSFNTFFKSKSIVTELKENGYKTYWLSNQSKIGVYDTYITSIANEADLSYIANTVNAQDQIDVKPDGVLLKKLDDIINNSTNKNELFIFHLLGSHVDYAKRYEKDIIINKEATTPVEKYDNSIFYTDYILKQIFNRFKKLDSKILLIYLSDHSELITNNLFGHGFSPSYKDEYEIPFIVYSSIENEKIKDLKEKNLRSVFNTEDFNLFLKYILGWRNSFKDISSSEKVIEVHKENIVDYKNLRKGI